MSDELVIDEGFRTLLIPLTGEERQLLEESIKEDGCRDALVAWPQTGGKPSILVDGHNRLEICTRLNISYAVTHRGFESREEVELWIIRNQLGRRNLESWVRGEYALRITPVVEEQAKRRMSAGGGDKKSPEAKAESGRPISDDPIRTDEVVAKLAGLGRDSIRKIAYTKANAIPEVIEKARTGELSINKAATVASVPAEEQPAMLAKMTAPKAERLAETEAAIAYYRHEVPEYDKLVKWVEELGDFVRMPEHRRSIKGLYQIADAGRPLVKAATAVKRR